MSAETWAFKLLLGYEATAVFTAHVPTVTGMVRRLPWPGRVAAAGVLSVWLWVHFETHEVPWPDGRVLP